MSQIQPDPQGGENLQQDHQKLGASIPNNNAHAHKPQAVAVSFSSFSKAKYPNACVPHSRTEHTVLFIARRKRHSFTCFMYAMSHLRYLPTLPQMSHSTFFIQTSSGWPFSLAALRRGAVGFVVGFNSAVCLLVRCDRLWYCLSAVFSLVGRLC